MSMIQRGNHHSQGPSASYKIGAVPPNKQMKLGTQSFFIEKDLVKTPQDIISLMRILQISVNAPIRVDP